MYNTVLQLIDSKSFDCEYSISTIESHGLYKLSDSQKRLIALYGFDPNDWLYHREDSKIRDDNQLSYMRIEFINPTTNEELVFTWEDSNDEN